MERAIGGYFELELGNVTPHYHATALALNTGRCCLEYILQAKQYRKIYVPLYTCDVVLEPVKKIGIEYVFYSIDDNLEPVFQQELKKDEVFLYTNYFGVKQKTVEKIAAQFPHVIIDNSQAFYDLPVKGTDTFYSVRKFVGVPDGAYLYTDTILQETLPQDVSYNRMSHLLKRLDVGAEAGYTDFCTNDEALVGEPIKRISNITEKILGSVNHEPLKKIRKKNFLFLHQQLQQINELQLGDSETIIPMVYPYRTKDIALREKLIANKIFVAKYWPNVLQWCKPNQLEYQLTQEIIPLPIDQRWNEKDMEKILNILLS